MRTRSRPRARRHELPSAIALVVLAALAAGAAACGGSGGHQTAADGTEAAPAARRFLSLGTAPAGGAFFVVGGALAEVASAHGGAGWSVTAEATKGSRENIRRLALGQLDFGLANSAITYFAVRGERGWDRPYPMRSVMTLAPNVGMFVAPDDSGIGGIGDLAGKRVVIGPAGAGFEMFVGPILEAHGISLDDLTVLHNTQSGTVDMLADGSADAAFLGGAVPTPSIVQAATSMRLVFVPIAPEVRQTLIDSFPFFRAITVPAGTYRGLDRDFPTLVTGAMHLIADESTDEALVYAFAKAIYEHRDQVVERHPAGRAINPGNVVIDRGTPFHPGAERFYREIGIWPDAEAEAADAEAADAEAAGDDAGSP